VTGVARFFVALGGAIVTTAIALAAALAAMYAQAGSRLEDVRWGSIPPEIAKGFPSWYLPLAGAAMLVTVCVMMLWATTAASEDATPRLRVASLAPVTGGPRGFRSYLRDVPMMLRVAAVVLAVVAVAGPEDVLRGEGSEERGIDIVLVLDLSLSMNALMDAPAEPVPAQQAGARVRRLTRLATAKEVILDFIARRKTDRIGVVVFGRSAYILSPPTLDKTVLATLVEKMELGLIDGHGTAIGDAVGTAVARLRRSNARSKAIILLTDGDSNAGSVAPEYAAHLAQTQGVRVYTVQIGNGDEVDVLNGTDIFGQPRYQRTKFPVNPELLQKMAHETGGESFVATDKRGLEESMHKILDQLEKTRFEAQAPTTRPLFTFFLFPAVILVALEALARLVLLRRFP
jgi:Ca-activated chloride channel family protein